MKPFGVLALSLLFAVPARADDQAARAQVHVTADGPSLSFVQETPQGRVVVCARMPCDVVLDPNGVYRFVGAPGTGARDSPAIVVQAGSRVDLDVKTRTNGGFAYGWAFIGIGTAVIAAGIVAVVFGSQMNMQAGQSGQGLELLGVFTGIVPGGIMGLWGIGGVARNLHSYVTATAPEAPPQSPPPPAALPMHAFIVPLVAVRF